MDYFVYMRTKSLQSRKGFSNCRRHRTTFIKDTEIPFIQQVESLVMFTIMMHGAQRK